MGAHPRGHVGAWDIPWIEQGEEFAPAQLDVDPFAQPFADRNPVPTAGLHPACPDCWLYLEPDGSCLRCSGCKRCGTKLDRDLNCTFCSATRFGKLLDDDQEEAA